MHLTSRVPDVSELLSDADPGFVRTNTEVPEGRVPLTEEALREASSGDMFGLTQNAAWDGPRRRPHPRRTSC